MAEHLRRLRIGDIDAGHGEGLRSIIVSQAGNFAALEGDALARFLARVAEGRTGQAARIGGAIARRRQGSVFE